MRACLLLALGLVAACARGSTGEGDPSLELQSTEAPTESEPTRLPPTLGDASSPTGDDAGTNEDSSSRAPVIDAAPPKPNACLAAVDISKGMTFTADTCVNPTNLPATCGAKGSGPGIVLRGEAPASGSTYQIIVASDWVVQQVDASCKVLPYSCAAAGWGVSGFAGATHWYFVVERADGACGSTTVTVNRVQ